MFGQYNEGSKWLALVSFDDGDTLTLFSVSKHGHMIALYVYDLLK